MSWIKVEDRLPISGERVLVTDGFLSFEATFESESEWVKNDSYKLIEVGYIVKAWQPMPKWEVNG